MKENKKKIKTKEQGITLIALVITIIVLLILTGVSIAMLTGNNGILTQAQRAKELTEISSEEEYINLLIIEHEMDNNITYGEQLKEVQFNTVENTTSIYDAESGTTYANGWYYLKPEDVDDYELKNSYIIDYETGEFVRFDEEKHRVVTNELLCITDGLVYSADPKNMTGSDSWGDAILHNFNEGDENSGWSENALMFDGVDDGIEVKDNSDYSQGITLEIYLNLKGKSTSDAAQILMMKRTNTLNGFFIFLGGGSNININEQYGRLSIDIGGSGNNLISGNRFITDTIIEENVPTYITYTYNPNAESDNGILYINGKRTQATNLGKIENLVNTPADTPIQIGSDIYETYNSEEGDTANRKYPFYGEIYASRVYNRPLTEQEVEYNYNTTVNNSN